MVSTRQMTIGNNITGEGTSAQQQQQQQVCFEGPAKYTRSVTTTAGCSGMGGTLQSVRELPSSSQQVQHTTCFMDLPQEVVEKILSYLTFKNISALRFVCRRIDHICGQLLNSTFLKLQTKMLLRFQEIKSKMPRRESARRSHYLACESDIIETLHMRLTLLQMSFGKHIERKHCCFFPGEILDEVYRILHYIKTTPKLDLPYKVTDELFDLSTMAMEYFKEKIEPNLPEIAYFSTDFLNFTGSSSSKYLGLESSKALSDVSKDSSHNDPDALDSGEDLVETLPQSNMVLRKRIRKIKQGMKRYNSQLSLLRQDLRSCKKKTADQQKQISEQQKQLSDQQNQTIEYASRLDEYDKKNEEISRKFSTLLQELNKCKTELQYWRCKSPATPPCCTNCGNPVAPKPEELQALLNQGVDPEGLRLEPPGSDLMQTDQCSSGSGSSNSSNCIPKPEEEKDISQKDTVEGKDKERVKPEAIVKEKQEASKIPTVSQGMPAQIGRHTKRKSEEAKEDQQQQQQMTPKKTRRLSKMRSTNKRAKV